MNFKIKICGLKTKEAVETAIEAGADMIGFVFHARSPRHIVPEAAARLAVHARGRAEIVALVVDAGPGQLNVLSAQVSPDVWQLHGLETPTRCGEIKEWRRRPVMKAIGGSMGTLGGMAKGEVPYDAAAAAAAKTALVTAAKGIPAGFETQGGADPTSEAKPEIWTSWEDFVKKAGALTAAAEAADVSSAEAIAASLGALGGACKDCHSTYRVMK